MIDLRHQCANLGLEPVEIRTKDQITIIKNYLSDIGVHLENKEFIPLGFDYGCEKGACIGKFLSLNSANSKDVSEVFKLLQDTKNLLMKAWIKLSRVKKDDIIGIGYFLI